MHAEVIHRLCKIRHIGRDAFPEGWEASQQHGDQENHLLVVWQHQWPEHGDIRLQSSAGTVYQAPIQPYTRCALCILFLKYSAIARIICSLMCANSVLQPIFCSPPATAFVGKKDRCPTNAEKRIR
mmetsp:Transcript_27872/g.95088  ORF Transcript_27872/g.95088 Transcript_27872/m.95088 type:complete len:126 (+) Transcript_27872:1131-1508(+)